MLSHLSDVYRIVNPNPPDAVITQRREAIVAFLERLAEPTIRYACADIAAFGFGVTPGASQAAAAQLLIAAIQGPQPSFSSDIATNALDLRVCAGVALGEYLEPSAPSDEDEEGKEQGDSNEDMAALVISALATRPLPQDQHLAGFVSALLRIARQSLEKAGRAKRERPKLAMATISGTDVPSLLKNLNTALGDFADVVDRNLQADREELEILWWVFGGHSTTLGKPFQALDLAQRAMAAGSELAKIALLPPAPGSAQFLLAVLQEDRSLTLGQLMKSCGADILQSVAERAKGIETVLKDHPALLPLTWLCGRRIDSGLVPGWEAEFQQKTHVSSNDERTASEWAVQVFNECIAARFLAAGKAK